MYRDKNGKFAKFPTTYKAFDKDLSCKGFKFEVGKTYTHKGTIKICESGFHACENPFDCWNYYDINSRYAIVKQSGEIEKHISDSKIVSAKIKIEAELSISEFIENAVKWIIDKCKFSCYSAKIGSSGYSAKIGSSGNYAKIGSSGNYAQIGSSGYSAQIGSSGDYAQIGSSGYYAQIGSSGDYAKIGSSGNYAQIGSSGYSAKIGSSGNYAQIGSSGNYAKIGSSGYSAKIGSSGNYAQIETKGKNSVIACSGIHTKAKGKNGTWISIAEYDSENKCVGFATGCIGKNGLKEDIYYTAKNGELIPA